jgi:glycosyltransferase involved in cell wall biosynthesis
MLSGNPLAQKNSYINASDPNPDHTVLPSPTNWISQAASKLTSKKRNEAVECLKKVMESDSRNIAAMCNMARIFLEVCDYAEARTWARRCLEIDSTSWYAMELLADSFLSENEFETALINYCEAVKIAPSDAKPRLRQKWQENKTIFDDFQTRPKLSIICTAAPGMNSFIHDLARVLSQGFWTRKFLIKDPSDLMQAIAWGDVLWFEWANEVIAQASRLPQLVEKTVLVRLHGYELFSRLPLQINWNVVDRLVFVAEHKRQLFLQNYTDIIPVSKTVLIRNAVDTDRFSIAQDRPKNKNIVFVGNINYRKQPILLLQFFYELLQRDPEFRLHIRGTHQDVRIKMAMERMLAELRIEDKVYFHDRVVDLNEFYADKTYVVSTSIEESFHYAIGEGMAAGLKPVIHAWVESRDIWPEQFIFRNLDEFLKLFLDGICKPEEYRKYIVDHFSLAIQRERLGPVISTAKKANQVKHISKRVNLSGVSRNLPQFVVVDGAFTKISGHSMMFARDYTRLLKGVDVKIVASCALQNQAIEEVAILPILPSFQTPNLDLTTLKDNILKLTHPEAVFFFQSGDYTINTTLLALLLSQNHKTAIMYHGSVMLMGMEASHRSLVERLLPQANHFYIFGTCEHAIKAAQKIFPGYPNIHYTNQVYCYFDHMDLFELSADRSTDMDDAINIAYFGVSRMEKGFHHLPAIIKQAPLKYNFLIQLSPLTAGLFEPDVKEAIRKLNQHENVTYYQDMTAEAYKKFLLSGHISLMLYNPQAYFSRLSSIYTESLACGIPIVMTKDLWYAADLEKNNAGIGVDPKNPREVMGAIEDIADNYAVYSKNARNLFDNYFKANNNKSFLEKILAVIFN